MNYKKILVTISSLEKDVKVIQSALDAAHRYGAELDVLHVSTKMAGYPSRVFRTYEPVCTPEQLRELVEKYNSNGVSFHCEVDVNNNISADIVRRTKDFDLLVIGHEHTSYLEEVFSDSIDERIINRIHCDCLVVQLG